MVGFQDLIGTSPLVPCDPFMEFSWTPVTCGYLIWSWMPVSNPLATANPYSCWGQFSSLPGNKQRLGTSKTVCKLTSIIKMRLRIVILLISLLLGDITKSTTVSKNLSTFLRGRQAFHFTMYLWNEKKGLLYNSERQSIINKQSTC